MAKTEPWPVRLTIDGFDKAGRLMNDFGYRSRDVFAAHAMEALAAVKAGNRLPDFIDEARQRHQTIMMQRAIKDQSNVKNNGPENTQPGGHATIKAGHGGGSTGIEGCGDDRHDGDDRSRDFNSSSA